MPLLEARSLCHLLNDSFDSSLSGGLALHCQETTRDLSPAGVRQIFVSHQSAFSLSQCFLQLWRDHIRSLNSERGIPLPLFMGRSNFASPASVIRPAWISRSTRRMLLIDQALPARRCLNKSEYLELSRRLFLTSTQPKQSASSCASWSERYVLRGPFL